MSAVCTLAARLDSITVPVHVARSLRYVQPISIRVRTYDPVVRGCMYERRCVSLTSFELPVKVFEGLKPRTPPVALHRPCSMWCYFS